jgi:hypothetical protein
MNVATRLTMTISFFFLLNSAARFALCQFYWTHTISTANCKGLGEKPTTVPFVVARCRSQLVRLSAPANGSQATEMVATRNIVTTHASRTTKIMTNPVVAFERD